MRFASGLRRPEGPSNFNRFSRLGPLLRASHSLSALPALFRCDGSMKVSEPVLPRELSEMTEQHMAVARLLSAQELIGEMRKQFSSARTCQFLQFEAIRF